MGAGNGKLQAGASYVRSSSSSIVASRWDKTYLPPAKHPCEKHAQEPVRRRSLQKNVQKLRRGLSKGLLWPNTNAYTACTRAQENTHTHANPPLGTNSPHSILRNGAYYKWSIIATFMRKTLTLPRTPAHKKKKYTLTGRQTKHSHTKLNSPWALEGAVAERHRVQRAAQRPDVHPLVYHRPGFDGGQLGRAIRSAAHDRRFVFQDARLLTI